MKSKYLFLGLGVVLMLAVAAICLDPTRVLWGYLKGEAFYRDRPVSYWRHALQSQDPAVQEETFRSLKEGGPSAVPVLIALLGEKNSSGWEVAEVRVKAAELLGQPEPGGQRGDLVPPHQQPDAIPALIVALKDEDLHVRTVAATSLGAMAPKEAARAAIPGLSALLAPGDSASVAAARALRRFGPEARPALPALLEALKAKDSEVRYNAIWVLGKIGPAAREAVPALIAAMKDENALVREHAAEALGDIGPDAREGVPALIEILKDPVARVRRDAARSLGQIGPAARPAVPALKGLLKDEDQKVREAATKAVRILETPDS